MKHRIQSLFLVFLLISSFSCIRKSEEIGTITVNVDNQVEKSFDDYISHIEIIPLEVNESSILRKINKVIERDNKFYIQNTSQNILVFSDSGKYLGSIGKPGRGPGELGYVVDFQFNNYNNTIEVLEAKGTIKVFDINGRFLDIIKCPTNEVSSFFILNEDHILFSHNRSGCGMDIFSRKGDSIVKQYFVFPFEFFQNHPIRNRSHFYNYNGDLYIHHGYTNEIYLLDELNLKPIYKLDLGKNTFDASTYTWPGGLPYNEYLNTLKNMRVVFGYHEEFQTEKYLFTRAYYRDDEIVIVLDKNTHKTEVFKHIKNLIKYDMTDIDRNLNFWSNEILDAYENGSRILEILNNDSNKDYIIASIDYSRRNIFVNENKLDDLNKAKFRQLSVNDNPVLLKLYFTD